MRVAGSTGANPFACISAGIGALWGPAHGGANEACLRMLEEIGSIDRIPEYIKKAKDPNDPFRLMGLDIESIKTTTLERPSCVKLAMMCLKLLADMMSHYSN